MLRGCRPEHRELWFIFGQLIYSVIFMIPAAALLIHSAVATNVALVLIFWVAAWNGASFYVEVFGRKFERELEKLRGEMEAMSSGATSGSGRTPSNPGTPFTPAWVSVSAVADINPDHSPLVLPAAEAEPVSALELDVKLKSE
jgi:hypothetical protein